MLRTFMSQKQLMASTTKGLMRTPFRACVHSRSHIAKSRQAVGDASEAAVKADIRQLARMSQIAITEQEAKDMEPKIKNILNWFDQLQAVDTQGVLPAIHASEQGTALRQDQPATYDARPQLLAQAPATQGSYVRVPKIATAADADAGTPAKSASPSPSPTPSAPTSSASSPQGGSAAPSSAEQTALLAMDFRVGRIVACEKHPEADSLYVERIDIGEPEPRTIVSGLVKYVTLEDMQNRMVVVIANLKPRNMRGIKSAGMVLAASDEDKTQVIPICPPAGAAVGERLWFGSNKEQATPAAPNAVEKKKLWEVVAPGLRTDASGTAGWKGDAMMTSAGAVVVPTLPNCRVA